MFKKKRLEYYLSSASALVGLEDLAEGRGGRNKEWCYLIALIGSLKRASLKFGPIAFKKKRLEYYLSIQCESSGKVERLGGGGAVI